MENKKIESIINNAGNLFYLKWKKDTMLSLFVIAPISFLFVSTCFTMIVGLSIKLLLILILPIILIIILFIYTPFFVRRKYVNNMVKSILIEDNTISVETFKWFKFDSIKISALITDIEIKESTDVSFFRGKRLYLLNIKGFESVQFYIINDFFDNIDDFENLLK